MGLWGIEKTAVGSGTDSQVTRQKALPSQLLHRFKEVTHQAPWLWDEGGAAGGYARPELRTGIWAPPPTSRGR